MSADKFQLLVSASASTPAAELVADAFTKDGLAAAPRYDIRTAAGITLWREIALADVSRLIKLRRELPGIYPEWQRDLIAHPLDDAQPPHEVTGAALSPEGRTLASLNGQVEELRYCGGTLGLGFDSIEIDVRTPTRRATISLEVALRHLDLFEPKTRWRLVVGVEHWFDCKLGRGGK